MPHWINTTGRSKGQKFMCSECRKSCNCIGTGNASKFMDNYCDYQFCPRCGREMDLSNQTRLVQVEKPIADKGEQE